MPDAEDPMHAARHAARTNDDDVQHDADNDAAVAVKHANRRQQRATHNVAARPADVDRRASGDASSCVDATTAPS